MEDEKFEFLIFSGNLNYKVFGTREARLKISNLFIDQRYKDLEKVLSHKGNQEALICMYGQNPKIKIISYLADEMIRHAHPLTVAKLRLLGVL